jgi:hypothetical protein
LADDKQQGQPTSVFFFVYGSETLGRIGLNFLHNLRQWILVKVLQYAHALNTETFLCHPSTNDQRQCLRLQGNNGIANQKGKMITHDARVIIREIGFMINKL